MRKIITFLPLLIACFLLIGCFSPWRGNEGNFTVTIGSSPAGSRALFQEVVEDGGEDGGEGEEGEGEEGEGEGENDGFTYVITVHNGPGPDQIQIVYPGTPAVSFSVTPGRWTISVNAYQELNEDMGGEVMFTGTVTVNIKPGPNGRIPIRMGLPPVEVTVTFDLNYGEEPTTWDVPVISGEKVQRPGTPTRDDEYGFINWYTEAECINVFDFDTPISENITLYARWLKILTIAVDPPTTALEPNVPVTVTVTVSGFLNEDDAEDVELDITAVEGLTFEVIVSTFDETTKTFTVEVTYDGTTPFPDGSVTITITIAELPGMLEETYYLPVSGEGTITISE